MSNEAGLKMSFAHPQLKKTCKSLTIRNHHIDHKSIYMYPVHWGSKKGLMQMEINIIIVWWFFQVKELVMS